jgi:spore germination protein
MIVPKEVFFMKKKTAVLTVSYLTCAVLALGVFSWSGHREAEMYKNYMAATYQRAFGELCSGMNEVDAALQKSIYATSPSVAGALCTDLFGKAMTCQMSMGALPFSTQELEETAAFISHVGDYAYALSRRASQGENFTQEELENLRALSDTATVLAQNLNQLQTDMAGGTLTMGDLVSAQEQADTAEENILPSTLGESMRLIEKEFPEVPALIYDGPFSEHITDMQPKMLEGQNEVTTEEGRKAAADFLGVDEGKVYLIGASGGDLPTYQYAAQIQGGEMTVEVTKQGGLVLGVLSSRMPGEGNVTPEEAIQTAKRFLERRGYTDMTESYYMVQDNVITINFAYEQDGVICYSDLVKVSVAKDTGGVCGFESRGYLTTHCVRELPEPVASWDQAREMVSDSLEILSEKIALVPSDGKYETLCYEFTCQTEDDRHYMIYVNAETGEQEKILILIEDENGTLTL